MDQYYILGKAYYLKNNYVEAERYYKKYLHLNPDSASAINYLGNIYACQAKWEKAIDAYQRALAEMPDDPIRVYDPQDLLRGHEPMLKELYVDSAEWRVKAKNTTT